MICVLFLTTHMSEVLLILHLKLTFHKIKMNGEIHVNNLYFEFFLEDEIANKKTTKTSKGETAEERESFVIYNL